MGMPETVCRTSESDVMSFHFSKQDLIEPALNFLTFSSRICTYSDTESPNNHSDDSSDFYATLENCEGKAALFNFLLS